MLLLVAALAAAPQLIGQAGAANTAVRWAGLPLLALAAALASLAGIGGTGGGRGAGRAHGSWAPGGAATSAVPVLATRRRALILPAAWAAGLAAGLASWPALALSLVLLVVADRMAGERWERAKPRARPGTPSVARPLGTTRFALGVAWRALGWRRAVDAFAVALLPLLAAAFFLHNNPLPGITAADQQRAAVLGGGTASVVLLARLGGTLASRRPAWPWARSLALSSGQRVRQDSLVLAAPCLPLIAAAAWLVPSALAPLLATLPLLALLAATALRRPPVGRLGTAGEIVVAGLLIAGVLALLPWSAVAFLLGAPWAARHGAARERRLKPSLWLESHHLAAGDPASWSGG
jgi:hypothetical protein